MNQMLALAKLLYMQLLLLLYVLMQRLHAINEIEIGRKYMKMYFKKILVKHYNIHIKDLQNLILQKLNLNSELYLGNTVRKRDWM